MSMLNVQICIYKIRHLLSGVIFRFLLRLIRYIYIYIYAHTYTHTHTYIYIYIYIYIHTF